MATRVTLAGNKITIRRVDCFNAVDPPFFLPHSTPHTKTASTASFYDSEYSRSKAAEHGERRCAYANKPNRIRKSDGTGCGSGQKASSVPGSGACSGLATESESVLC